MMKIVFLLSVTFFGILPVNATVDVFLDVRTPEEFKEDHIPGSVLVNFKDADVRKQLTKLDKNARYKVYCAVGGRSFLAARILKQEGFQSVKNIGSLAKAKVLHRCQTTGDCPRL